MARIGATLSGVERMLLNRLAEADAAVTLNSLRLATEKRINSPRDDPSTFVTLSRLQSQVNLVTATTANVTAAGSMVTQAQTTLGQMRTQLTTIRTELLKDENRTLTPAQRATAQANVDAAVRQVNQLSGTDIDGRRLLDGSADFDVSGRNNAQVANVEVHSVPGNNFSGTISGSVLAAATRAQSTYTGSGGQTTSAATFTLTGDLGSVSLSVTNGQNLDGTGGVAEAINNNSHKTGITASVAGDVLTLTSVNYGSSARIAVTVTSGVFSVASASGTNASARINGQTYTGQGNRFTVNENGFQYDLDLVAGYSGDIDAITVSGEALTFALSTDVVRRSRLAIPGLQANRLGGLSGTLDQIASGGPYAGLDGNTSRAIRIVDEALGDLDRVIGSVDGFYNAAITSSSELLADLETELEDSISQTDGFNQAEEETLLAKNEQLVFNGLAALTVLNGQRAAMVQMLQRAAGLI